MASALPPEALAFLDAISGPESRGLYDIRYGGGRFSDFTDHPRTHKKISSGPNKGKTSSAAGRYQITETTWDNVIQPALNLPDFSPESQDIAAWYLAQQDYRRKAGKDLLGTLRSGDPEAIGTAAKKLAGTWTSLPSGIEATTTTKKFLNAYNEAFQNRNVAPVPATRTGALQAIEGALGLPGTPPAQAAAYAPPSGSLQAPPAGSSVPSIPRGTAPPLPARTALPVPPGTAAPIPPRTALPVPPVAATTPRASLPAVSPLVPTIQAREPWSPYQEQAILRGPPKPVPPSSTFELGMMMPEYAANYVPTSQRVNPPGLTTRKVNTVPIDPMTGSVKVNMQSVAAQEAARLAAQKRSASLNAAATSSPVVDPNAARLNRAFLNNLAETRPTTTPPPVTIPVTVRPPQTTATPGIVRTATSPAVPTIRPTPTTTRAPSIPVPTIKAVEIEPERTGLNAFGYTPAPLPPRLTPSPELVPTGYVPPPPGRPGSIRTGAVNAPLGAMTSPLRPQWGRRGVPPEEQTNPTAEEVVAGLANGSMPYTSPFPRMPPGTIGQMTSPGAQAIGRMNMGENPLGKFLLGLFLPKEGQVSTARSVTPPTYGLQGGRRTPVPANTRTLSEATQRLVRSGGNSAWRHIMENEAGGSEVPRFEPGGNGRYRN